MELVDDEEALAVERLRHAAAELLGRGADGDAAGLGQGEEGAAEAGRRGHADVADDVFGAALVFEEGGGLAELTGADDDGGHLVDERQVAGLADLLPDARLDEGGGGEAGALGAEVAVLADLLDDVRPRARIGAVEDA